MTSTLDLRGLWVPVVTPFTAHDTVDHGALERLVDRLLGAGACGIVALGTTGEPATLTPAERGAVVATCAAACAAHGRPLMVGCGTNATATTRAEVAAWSAMPGVTALLLVTPYFTRPTEADAVEHLRVSAAASSVPVVVYNVPHRTGCRLGADALTDLAVATRVIGVKQAVGALDHDTLDLLRRAPAHFAVLAGDDAFAAPSILLGGAGAIAAAAHLATGTFVAMVAAALAGDVAGTRARAAALLPVIEAGFAAPNPSAWKGALHARGELATASVRRPLGEADTDVVRRLLVAADTAEGLVVA